MSKALEQRLVQELIAHCKPILTLIDHDSTALNANLVPLSLTIVVGPGLMLISTGISGLYSLE